MKRNIARKWISALRSGHYKKTKGALKRVSNQNESFCALGVLCDLYQKEHIRGLPEDRESEDIDGKKCVSFDGIVDLLPDKVRKWAGIKSESCEIPYSKDIPLMNDGGDSFKKIADVIEKNIEEI